MVTLTPFDARVVASMFPNPALPIAPRPDTASLPFYTSRFDLEQDVFAGTMPSRASFACTLAGHNRCTFGVKMEGMSAMAPTYDDDRDTWLVCKPSQLPWIHSEGWVQYDWGHPHLVFLEGEMVFCRVRLGKKPKTHVRLAFDDKAIRPYYVRREELKAVYKVVTDISIRLRG